MVAALVLTAVFTTLAPGLRVIDTSPFTVAGRHFHAHETVAVTLRSGREARLRHPRTGARGAFRVIYRGIRIEPCAGWSVRAVGGAATRRP